MGGRAASLAASEIQRSGEKVSDTRLDLVIVAFNSKAALLRSMPAARQIAGVGRIVVVDNGTDGSGVYAAGLGAEVVHLDNPGFGSAQNAGVALCSAPYVLLLNPDAEPVVSGISAGLSYLDGEPDVGATQGVIVNRATDRPERSQGAELGPVHLVGRALALRHLLGLTVVRRAATHTRLLRDHAQRIPAEPTDVESLAATAVLVRTSAFREVGGFDERFFLYGEDLDLSRRMRLAGWRLVALPDRWAMHTSGESSANWFDRELRWWEGTMQFAALWWGSASWGLGATAAFVQFLRLGLRAPSRIGEAWNAVVAGPKRHRRKRSG